MVRSAAWQGLALEGLARFRYGRGGPVRRPDMTGDSADRGDGLVLAYGAAPEHAYAGALDALCRVLA